MIKCNKELKLFIYFKVLKVCVCSLGKKRGKKMEKKKYLVVKLIYN